MIEFEISMDELTAIARRLRRLPDFADRASKDVAVTLRRLVKGRTPVGKTRVLKNSWSRVQKESTGFSFSNETPYAHVLEEGLYPSVGPRTTNETEGGVALGGVYSRQAPGGMIAPIIGDDKIITDVVRGVLTALARGMD